MTESIFKTPPCFSADAECFFLSAFQTTLFLSAVLQPNPARVWPLTLPRLHGNLHSIHEAHIRERRTQILRDLIAQKLACFFILKSRARVLC